MCSEKEPSYPLSGKKELFFPACKPWRIILSLGHKQDEKLFAKQLSNWTLEFELDGFTSCQKEETTGNRPDLLIFDEGRVPEIHDRVRQIKKDQNPLIGPSLALVSETGRDQVMGDYGAIIDELMVKPVKTVELHKRLTNLLRIRELSLEIEEKHRTITRNSHELISIIDGDGRIYFTNKPFEYLFGYDPKKLEGQLIYNFIYPGDVEALRNRITQFVDKLKEKEPEGLMTERIGPIRVQTRDGSIRWVEPLAAPIKRKGENWRLLLTSRDVTEHKRTEERLREERDRAQNYLEIAGTMIVVLDSNYRVEEVNKRACEILGYTKEEMLGAGWYENFVPESVRKEVIEKAQQPLMAGREKEAGTYQNPVLTKEGEERIISWRNTTLSNEKGEITGTLSSGRDITDLLQLQRSHKLFSTSLERADLGVFWVTPAGEFAYTNQTVKDNLGYSREELEGMPVWEVTPRMNKDDWPDFWDRLQNEKVLKFESVHEKKDGETFPVEITSHYIQFKGEEYAFTFVQDITRRKKDREWIEYLNALLRSIGDINELIVREDDFEDILRQAQRILLDRDNYFVVEFYVFREGGDDLYVGGEGRPSINLEPDGTGEGPNCIKKALKSNEPVVVDYPARLCSSCDFHVQPHPSEHQTIVLPLSVGDRREGVLVIGFSADQTVREKEVDMLAEVSTDLAFARDKLRVENELEETTIGTLKALSRTVEAKDEYTGEHINRVQEYALKLGEKMGMSDEELNQLRYGAELHDVGKVKVPDAILGKPSQLTDEEWEEMEKHPEIGEQIVGAVPRLKQAATIIGQHQEKYDGTGYPRGLKGEDIVLGARIIAVVDAWDAMRTDRPYRDALSKQVASDELKGNSGTQFDPDVINLFIDMIEKGEDIL